MRPIFPLSLRINVGNFTPRARFHLSPAHPRRHQPTRRNLSPGSALNQPARRRHSLVNPRRFNRERHVYCDCGMLAVTVLKVLVGSEPQYTIRLPLCPACLQLEQDLEQ